MEIPTNKELRSEFLYAAIDRLRDEAKDLRSAIERRDEIIDGLKAEVERLRENQLNPEEKLHRLLHTPSLALRPLTRIEENHGD